MSHLSLKSISKSFGSFQALKDLSLDIGSGEFICLLGASGCGKTTLLRLIAGLETFDQGSMMLDGQDLSKTPCHKRNIGMVFQSLALFPHLNVADNVAYGLKLKGVSKTERDTAVKQLLSMVGLEGLEQRSASALSGGQRQRVAIARALALKPSIFLMDEPFSALDAGLRDHLQLEVKKLQQDLGVTTIFVTHDQREAMALADRIVVMNQGKIEQTGAPQEIYARPLTRHVAEFIGNNNLLDIEIDAQGQMQALGLDLGPKRGSLASLRGRQTLAIRPEQFVLNREAAEQGANLGHDQGLRGHVSLQRTLGALVETEVQIGSTLLKHSAFSSQALSLTPGESVTLHADLDDAWVIPS